MLAGLGAIIVLLALLIGPPAVLITVFGLPVPHTMPSASLLTHRLQATAVLKACSVVVWLAWLQLVWCVVAEVAAAVRNVGMPRRVPLAGATQAAVHRLVTTALLVSTATAIAPAAAMAATAPAATAPVATLTPAPAGSAAPGTIPGKSLPASLLVPPAANGGSHRGGPLDVSQEYRPGEAAPDGNGTQARLAVPDGERGASWAHRTEKIYVVQPPAGRFHESLWEIAENHLGDGRRYREIFELNKGRPQPDGSTLTIASLIRPGWVLRMPQDAYGPGIEVATASPPARHSGRPHERPPSAQRSPAKHAAQPPAPPAPPATPVPPTPGAERAATPAEQAQRAAQNHTAPAHVARSPGYPLELAAVGLLAAGVLAALERRRRRQARRRPPGRRVVSPPPDIAQAEVALRLGEDEASARMLDTGLRYLARALHHEGRMPPTVFAAHLGEDNLDLWVSPPDHDAPGPWYAVGDGQVWRLSLADVSRLDPDQPGRGPALYPGLVTIGMDATGRVLVDLEAAGGLIAVTGPDELVAEALAAMAVELATSRWADAMRLTLVGADLEVLEPDRVRVVSSVAEALPIAEEHAAGVSDALAASDERSVLAGRAEGLVPEAWMPHFLITLIPPTEQEAQRLAALAGPGHQAAGYVVAGQVPGAAWTWEVTPDGRLRAPELGLDVAAQLIPQEQQVAVAGLFEAADDMAGALMSAPLLDAAPAPVPDATAPAEVTLLGPAAVRAHGDIQASMVPLATEIVIYLAAHPGGVYPNVLARAIWPQGVADEIRDGVLAAVARWLGTDGIGRPHLAADASGRLRLGSGVKVDWHVFLALVAQAAGAAGGKNGPAREEAKLAQALSLVTGQFLAGIGPSDYAWIAADGLEYEVPARVADAAHRLCELRRAAGDPRGAMDAVRTGLRLAPDDELLWRDLLTAAHATGQENLLYAAAGEVWTRACLDGPPPGMAPETEALLDEVLPTWRWSLA